MKGRKRKIHASGRISCGKWNVKVFCNCQFNLQFCHSIWICILQLTIQYAKFQCTLNSVTIILQKNLNESELHFICFFGLFIQLAIQCASDTAPPVYCINIYLVTVLFLVLYSIGNAICQTLFPCLLGLPLHSDPVVKAASVLFIREV